MATRYTLRDGELIESESGEWVHLSDLDRVQAMLDSMQEHRDQLQATLNEVTQDRTRIRDQRDIYLDGLKQVKNTVNNLIPIPDPEPLDSIVQDFVRQVNERQRER